MGSTNAPQRHSYSVSVQRDPMGEASYQLYQDGTAFGTGFDGAWDDATPWANGTYNATLTSHGGTAYRLDPKAFPNRSGILFHQDYGIGSRASQGCLVADKDDIRAIAAQISHDNALITTYNDAHAGDDGYKKIQLEPTSVNIIASGQQDPAQIGLEALTTTVGSDQYVRLQLSLTYAISKDVWVFIANDDPDDPNGKKFDPSNGDLTGSVVVLDKNGHKSNAKAAPVDFDPDGLVAGDAIIRNGDGTGDNSVADHQESGFWVCIPQGTTSEEVDVKAAYKDLDYSGGNQQFGFGKLNPGASRTETFTVADYGIEYNPRGNVGYLYKDGVTGGVSGSDLLTGGSQEEAPVNVTIQDHSHTVAGLGNVFHTQDPNSSVSASLDLPTWQFGVDPTQTKPHEITVHQAFGQALKTKIKATVKTIDGEDRKLDLTQSSDSTENEATFTFKSDQLKDTEGAITISSIDVSDPHGFWISVDGAGEDADGGSQPQDQPQQQRREEVVTSPEGGQPALRQEGLSGGSDADAYQPGGTVSPSSFSSSYGSDGTVTTTETDASGDVTYREIDSPDGTKEVMTYQINDQPYVSTDRTYDSNDDLTSATLYAADGSVYLTGTGQLNADGTTTVSLVDASGAVQGPEPDQPVSNGWLTPLPAPAGVTQLDAR